MRILDQTLSQTLDGSSLEAQKALTVFDETEEFVCERVYFDQLSFLRTPARTAGGSA